MKSTVVFFVIVLGVVLALEHPNIEVREDSTNSRCIWTFATDVPPSGCPVTFPATGMADVISDHIEEAVGDLDTMVEEQQLRSIRDGNNALKQQLERQHMTNDMNSLQGQIDEMTSDSTRMEEHITGMQGKMVTLMAQVEKLLTAATDLQATSD
ncbi:uncharacterized protein LOC118408072 isoform X1 [Branchiostoma floridae]|uniref:Uncharacterized protein LOC118408072 isoform X1 n=1 Tax=Branchiostoma floridae TaxID=7739 RepID=A0A9J7KKU3_BRAFL|nr:uncharacterized protein LOC118408072 isoform X1 [Branchiostoma floridae]